MKGNKRLTYMCLYVTLQSVNDVVMIVNTVDKHALVSIFSVVESISA